VERPALVLTHGIELGACRGECSPLVGGFPQRERYVLDWPGFGYSSRHVSRRALASALSCFIDGVIPRAARPVDLVGQGVGAEICARSAIMRPDLVRSLVLISPSGLASRQSVRRLSRPLVDFLRKRPGWRLALHGIMTSRSVLALRHWLRGDLDPELVRQAHEAARLPGAADVLTSLLARDFETPNAYERIYLGLRVSTMVLFDRGSAVRFARVPELTSTSPFVGSQPMLRRRRERGPVVLEAVSRFYTAIDAVEDADLRTPTLVDESSFSEIAAATGAEAPPFPWRDETTRTS
jgi:pimeloyl-ACP methyl ester carboxylesterase